LNDSLHLRIEYCDELFSAATIHNMAHHYKMLLESAVSGPDQQIGILKMVSDDEERQLLQTIAGAETGYPRNKTIVDLFEEQVLKTPGNIAVTHERISLTYHELNERANRLADHLKKKYKIGPDDLVALK